MAIHSSGETVFSLTHIEGVTLGAGEESRWPFILVDHVLQLNNITVSHILIFKITCVIFTVRLDTFIPY